MYKAIIKEKFAGAHNLTNYVGKCAKLHGHNWTVEVEATGNKLKNGMLIDFNDLKKPIKDLDHTYLNDRIKQPTAENIANYLLQIYKKQNPNLKYKIRIYETENNCIEVQE